MCKYGLLLDYAGDVVGFEFAVVGALIAANMCVEKLVKRRGVIMVARMAELVQKDKLAQVLRKEHDEERDADAIVPTA